MDNSEKPANERGKKNTTTAKGTETGKTTKRQGIEKVGENSKSIKPFMGLHEKLVERGLLPNTEKKTAVNKTTDQKGEESTKPEVHEICKRIKEERKKRGYSQTELSKMAGLSENYVRYIEQGIKNPTLATVFNIINALEIKPDLIYKKEWFTRNGKLKKEDGNKIPQKPKTGKNRGKTTGKSEMLRYDSGSTPV